MNLKDYIRSIPDYPKKGILFRDITTLLEDPKAFSYVIKKMHAISKKIPHTKIAAIEARGFVFAAALAYLNKKPLVLLRKKKQITRSNYLSKIQTKKYKQYLILI